MACSRLVLLALCACAVVSGSEHHVHVHFDESEVENAINVAAARVKTQLERSRDSGGRADPFSAAALWTAAHLPSYKGRNSSAVALIAEEATRHLVVSHGMDMAEVGSEMPGVDLSGTILGQYCPVSGDRTCQPQKYRSLDGFCNNVQHASWGSAQTAFARLLQPAYADGLSAPRGQSVSGGDLPSARSLSGRLAHPGHNRHEFVTALMAVWAEFVHHDLVHIASGAPVLASRRAAPTRAMPPGSALTAALTSQAAHIAFQPPTQTGVIQVGRLCRLTSDGGATSCCRDGAREPHCLPILSPGHCQEYVRSLSSLQMGCHLGPREQMNLATSFLDGSGLYGTTKQSAHRLRCPLAADPRANSHSAISAIYALLAREHNRIAAQLSETNPHWGDERTYQETRRLIIAQLQHITFKEFVPAVLGQEVTKFFDLELLSAGFHQHYSMDEYPGVSNAAASTALKFYLALLPGYLQYINVNGEAEGEAPLSASFFAPFDLYKEGRLEQVLLGLTGSQASQGDSITEQLTDALGLDLAADTIQQARDHGVAAYTQWRQLCGLPPVTQFRDLNTTMAPSKIDMLRSMYRSPADIDLFVGGVLESPVEGAVVGPTFACLLGQQFQLVRQTDRFWFENEVPPSAFTKEQLYQIRKSSMARLFCNNIDGVRELPPNVFLKQDPFLNAPVLCDMLPFLDLSAWKSARSGVLIPDDVFGDVVSKAKMDLERRRNEERILTELKLNADPKSSLGTAYAFSRPNKQAVLLSNTSLILEYASGEFMSTVFS
ncbi:Peroxidasin-like protein [Amphibalanus amphitrite]|uniref:Peroxidasin-like protein n=1 Tax=Amphibalanus amphitrite TaxID=1232801 RepID=A0A6A4XGP1_AMPAM|nr:Peroxidasin-like protein [Amphibalanus amphitrite]KAF0313954.1 Peroxidasin-like protein [Amphibalanus amphitrite]